MPGVLLVATLISIYFLCQSVQIWIMFPILVLVCVSIFLTPHLTCQGEIEFKRCYKISNVPAGMHLVVLLLSRHSQLWNSISYPQFLVSPNLSVPVRSAYIFPFFLKLTPKHDVRGSAEHGTCVVSGLLTWISEFELDNLIIIQVLTAKVACQGKFTNDNKLSLYKKIFLHIWINYLGMMKHSV